MSPRKAAAACIVGVGATPLYRAAAGGGGVQQQQQQRSALALMVDALHRAIADAGISPQRVDTLIAVPSLMPPPHFMAGHAVAQAAGLLPRRAGSSSFLVRTIDVGGAGPVSALLAAARAIEHEGRRCVAVVAGDAVGSAPLAEFLARADAACAPLYQQQQQQHHQQQQQQQQPAVPSPVIPHLYGRVARRMLRRGEVTREQLAMVAALMGYQEAQAQAAAAVGAAGAAEGGGGGAGGGGASHHQQQPQRRRLQLVRDVLASGDVAPATTRLECARRADGAAAYVLVAAADADGEPRLAARAVDVLGGGEASGPLTPPAAWLRDDDGDGGGAAADDADDIDPYTSAAEAAALAYAAAGLLPVPSSSRSRPEQHADDVAGAAKRVDLFWLYDCFPVCFVRAVEAVGLARRGGGGGGGGLFVERAYRRLLGPLEEEEREGGGGEAAAAVAAAQGKQQQRPWPVNTNGGLLGAGAPWEAPAAFGVAACVAQLRGEAARGVQVAGARRALVYANGGVLSASAVAILARRRRTPADDEEEEEAHEGGQGSDGGVGHASKL